MKTNWMWAAALTATVLVACASKEIEFRDFATLKKADVELLKAEIRKPKPGKVKLASGQTAQCSAKVCHVNWVARNVSLHIEEETKTTLAVPKGSFTLESEEIDDLLARMAASAEAEEEMVGRIGNLGHLCSAAECKLSVFVASPDEDDAKAANAIRQSIRKGKVFRDSPNE